MPRSLETVVTDVATRLMAVGASTSAEASTAVLADLVSHLDVDASFLRHNDHLNHTTIMVAEWPPRPPSDTTDPLAVVRFADADPVFAATEHLKEPAVIRPGPANAEYQHTIEAGRNIASSSLACAPLLSGDVTIGVLGFVKFGDRAWTTAELNALKAVASLFAQVQARIAAEERLRHLAEHDDLTGLHNRRALMAHLDQRLAAGTAEPISVLFIDLDRLKVVNDYLGYSTGDSFIRILGQGLEHHAGATAFIARLGGDEFVVVPTASMSIEHAETYAHHLQTALRRVVIDGEIRTRTVSIGLVQAVPGHDDSSTVLSRADKAVRRAKAAGGDQVAIFSDAMASEADLRDDIELHLRNVIEDGALVLHYLPEVDLRTGEILAAEALVRWRHPTRGLLPPEAFIGVAESINMAADLGRWVLRTACAEYARWRSHGVGEDVLLRVNVSPVQLVTEGFTDWVAATLDEFGLPCRSVCLEITESVVVQDIETTRATLSELKDVGIRVAIDDFGTGYSVLPMLKTLPVDTLKIDRSFVAELGENPGDLPIVRALIGLATAFGLDIVAEGVETELAARTLLAHGCHRAQGFLLSIPVPGAEMLELLTKGRVPVHFAAAPHV